MLPLEVSRPFRRARTGELGLEAPECHPPRPGLERGGRLQLERIRAGVGRRDDLAPPRALAPASLQFCVKIQVSVASRDPTFMFLERAGSFYRRAIECQFS
jgi:hypothetical protein